MERLRRAAVAGTWYPRQPALLAEQVDRYVADADVDPLPAVQAVIAPHAGLMYSGAVAAFSYAAARGTRYDTVVLVGPSHHVPFHGVSVWRQGLWETPFDPVAVDEPLASAIAAGSAEVTERVEAHRREHSLEMQMPFVAHLWPGVRIVPLVMGYQTRDTAFALGEAIARAVAARRRASTPEPPGSPPGDVLLVASSDLSHFEDARTAGEMDAVIMRCVEALDPGELMATLEREPRHACGGGPMVSVIHAAQRLGATRATLLHYADSGDVSGDKSSVVGYMAAAIW